MSDQYDQRAGALARDNRRRRTARLRYNPGNHPQDVFTCA